MQSPGLSIVARRNPDSPFWRRMSVGCDRRAQGDLRRDAAHLLGRIIRTGLAFWLICSVSEPGALGAPAPAAAPPLSAPVSGPQSKPDLQAELESAARTNARSIPPPKRHQPGLSAGQVESLDAQRRNELEALREKIEGKWFAALLDLEGAEPSRIRRTFATWDELSDYASTNRALVELWADAGGAGGPKLAHRITAQELTALRREDGEQPIIVTLTARDPATGKVESSRVEFAYTAAEHALAETLQSRAGDSGRANPAGWAAPLMRALHLDASATDLQMPPDASPPAPALAEGGVAEAARASTNGASSPAANVGPHFKSGTAVFDQEYTQVRDDLLEWRHFLHKKSLGLPLGTPELLQAADILDDLTRKGISVDDADALLSVDAVHSRFRYRRYVQGQPHEVEVTGVPPRTDLIRDSSKAEEGRRMDLEERKALSAEGHGIARVHRVRDVNGQPEVGPLVLSETSADGIDALLELLDKLPAINRARINFARSAKALIDADLDGSGHNDRFFVTVQFPPGKLTQRERVNPWTGEREILVSRDGLLVQAISDTRMIEFEYNSLGEETTTHTYANSGPRTAPVKSSLLEETRTVETWVRDWAQPDVDPALPTISKSKVNHVTGETTREIYGMFPFPVVTVDERFITYRQFNPYGVLSSATTFENGRDPADFQRPLLSRLNEPIIGRERFQFASVLKEPELSQLRSLKGQHYFTTLVRRDLIKGIMVTQSFDNAHWDRRTSESFSDRLEGTQNLPLTLTFEYRNDFFGGQVPVSAALRSISKSKALSQITTVKYDPFSRRWIGAEVDYTGKSVTNTWDRGWASPIEIQSAGRRTVYQYNHDETEVTGTCTLLTSGEELTRFKGRFDPKSLHWEVHQVTWLGAGITNQTQTLTLSAAGLILSSRAAETYERRLAYGADGVAKAAYLYRKNPGTGLFTLLAEQSDEFTWKAGQRTARVQCYAEGKPYRTLRRVEDEEGRPITEELTDIPGLPLKTSFAYEGWSARLLKAEESQNGQVRSTREPQPAERQPDGSYHIPVKVTPRFGLAWTERFRAGDPLHRPIAWRYDNGDILTVVDWFEGTDLPKRTELRDAAGLLKERSTRRLNAGTEGSIPCDQAEREQFSWPGLTAVVEKRSYARGTGILLTSNTSRERVYYDLTHPFDAPAYAVDSDAHSGVSVTIKGQRKDHVLRLYRSHLEDVRGPGRRNIEPLLSLDSIELASAPARECARRTFDWNGWLLDERFGTLPASAVSSEQDDALFDAMARVSMPEHFHYRYQPGWLVPANDPLGVRSRAFTLKRPGGNTNAIAVNNAQHREFLTGIEEIRSAPQGATNRIQKNRLVRRFERPRQLERNPYLPGATNSWTAWTLVELSPSGETVSESEIITDARGEVSVSKMRPAASSNTSSERMVYRLPELDSSHLQDVRVTTGTNSVPLSLGGDRSLDGCDFLYFYLLNTNRASWTVVFKSAAGQEVRIRRDAVAKKGEAPAASLTNFSAQAWSWPAASSLPALVWAPPSAQAADNAVLLSVPELARAGLDVAHVASATLQLTGKPGSVIKVGQIGRMQRVRSAGLGAP